jgi:2-C-methyl-D-erythritol 4-phosphate cytidylyltransferase
MAKISVIVVAAGKGERFGDQESKVFAKLDGQPLFLRALQLFVNRDDVCQTILVVGPHDIGQMKEKFGPNIGFMGVKLVEGGVQRHESVANGLAEVDDQAEFVAVHDAARVCVAAEWIDAIFLAAAKSGAAVPVTPVTATLKRVGSNDLITETVSRQGLHLAQTPQVFRKDIITKAYAGLRERDSGASGDQAITDDAQVVAAADFPVTAVRGDPRNIKITTRDDLRLAGAVLKVLPQKKVSKRGPFEEAQW